MREKRSSRHIVLTSHPSSHGPKPIPVRWGAATPMERGPIIGTLSNPDHRNVIGTHNGAYALYRALAIASGGLDPEHVPDLTLTSPTFQFGPHPQWSEPDAIVSLDPHGAIVRAAFAAYFEQGFDIRPTIAVTRAHIHLPELANAIRQGRLQPDGKLLLANGDAVVAKAAVEPVWHLPGVARRFGIEEQVLRRALFEETAGMYPELVTRPDFSVFLPPIGGLTVYFFGDPEAITDPARPLAVRVHDECNGSDVFGSDICTCRPYLAHGIEVAVKTAQEGGAGVIVYFRKEGRALGEVTKFLVYNARKRQKGGDSADKYFYWTECVAGTQDVRFQELMPDVLHWLGIRRIDRFVSMSNMKYDAIVGSGIEIAERIRIPDELVPEDAKVEIHAKMAAGYYTEGPAPNPESLSSVVGRELKGDT